MNTSMALPTSEIKFEKKKRINWNDVFCAVMSSSPFSYIFFFLLQLNQFSILSIILQMTSKRNIEFNKMKTKKKTLTITQ